jgi:hypothetical protein
MRNNIQLKKPPKLLEFSYSRIRQMAAADEIDYQRFGNLLVITEKVSSRLNHAKLSRSSAQKQNKKAA